MLFSLFASACRAVVFARVVLKVHWPLPGALSGRRSLRSTHGLVEMAPPDSIDLSAEEAWRA